jgi:hypothetical protein
MKPSRRRRSRIMHALLIVTCVGCNARRNGATLEVQPQPDVAAEETRDTEELGDDAGEEDSADAADTPNVDAAENDSDAESDMTLADAHDAVDVTDMFDVVDASEPSFREPTCTPGEQPEYRTISAILHTATQLIWLQSPDESSMLLSSDGVSLSAFSGPVGTPMTVVTPSDLVVERVLGAGYVDGLGSTVLVREAGSNSVTLLTAEREESELALERHLEVFGDAIEGGLSALVQDQSILVQTEGLVTRYEWRDGGFERACEFESQTPVQSLRDGEWLIRTTTSNSAGDVRQSAVDSNCAEVGNPGGTDLSRQVLSAVVTDAEGSQVVLSVGFGFSLYWYDGENEGFVEPSLGLLSAYSNPVVDVRPLRLANEARGRLLVNGELVVDPFGGEANFRLEGGLPAVGSSDAAASVVQSARGLVWRPSEWSLAGEPVVLAGQAFSVGWAAYDDSTVLLREVRSGFASSPQVSGVRVDPGQYREVVTTFDNSALAFPYQGVRWSSDWPGTALSSEPEVIMVSEGGTSMYASSAVGRSVPVAFGEYWVPAVTGGVCSAVLRPNTVPIAEPSDELPEGIEWSVFGDGEVRSVQGTRSPAIDGVVYLRDGESDAHVMVTHSGSTLSLYRISVDGVDVALEAGTNMELESLHSLATLGDPRDGLLLAVTSNSVQLLALRQLELQEIGRYESPIGFAAQRFLDDGRHGVVLIDRAGGAIAWFPDSTIGMELGVPPATAGVVGDLDMDGQVDLMLRHAWDSENEFLYFADCWD